MTEATLQSAAAGTKHAAEKEDNDKMASRMKEHNIAD